MAIVTLRAENGPTQAVKDALLPEKVITRAAITDEKVFGQFLRDLDAYTGAGVIKDALLFQIVTMTRPGEVRGAKQDGFDLDNATWTTSGYTDKVASTARFHTAYRLLRVLSSMSGVKVRSTAQLFAKPAMSG